jgi:IS605 OrfB family transposase
MLSTGEFKFSKKWNKNVEIKTPSNNRKKATVKLAKVHQKIKNQKLDYLHNITTKIVNENQVIVLEDLNVSGMMKNHKLAKSIQELGLYEMRRQFEYKSKWYGRELIFVSRWFPSSKTCSCCGWKNNNLKLSDREFICEECGLVIDRDENAAINIENEGIRIYEAQLQSRTCSANNETIGQRLPEFEVESQLGFTTPVDYPLMDDPTSNGLLRSNGRLKQEEKAMHKFV